MSTTRPATLDAEPHPVQQLGAAGQHRGVGLGRRSGGVVHAGGASVGERAHQPAAPRARPQPTAPPRRSADRSCSGRCCRSSTRGSHRRPKRDPRGCTPTAEITWPGVQNPHWNASWSMNARCTGCSASGSRQSLHGRHLAAVGRRREHHAAVHPAAVEQDRARPAFAAVAALLGAGQVEVLAQQVQQRRARIDVGQLVVGAVHGQPQGQSLSEHVPKTATSGLGAS